MATTTYKVLGQLAPSATTQTTLYTVPASTQAVISSITIANRSTATTFRIAVQPAGASLVNAHYLAYDVTVGGNDTTILTLGITLGATDVVSVYAGTANLSFSLFGSQIA